MTIISQTFNTSCRSRSATNAAKPLKRGRTKLLRPIMKLDKSRATTFRYRHHHQISRCSHMGQDREKIDRCLPSKLKTFRLTNTNRNIRRSKHQTDKPVRLRIIPRNRSITIRQSKRNKRRVSRISSGSIKRLKNAAYYQLISIKISIAPRLHLFLKLDLLRGRNILIYRRKLIAQMYLRFIATIPICKRSTLRSRTLGRQPKRDKKRGAVIFRHHNRSVHNSRAVRISRSI